MDKSMIEYYHTRGSMPDRVYYQLNGRSAQENYIKQSAKLQENNLREKDLAELKKKI